MHPQNSPDRGAQIEEHLYLEMRRDGWVARQIDGVSIGYQIYIGSGRITHGSN
jgi:hypothetical protein